MGTIDPAVPFLKRGLGLFLCAALCVFAGAEDLSGGIGLKDDPKAAKLNPADPDAWAALGNSFVGSKEIARYYAKVLEKAHATARAQAEQRTAIEQAADAAAEAAQSRADDARRRIAATGSDPDDTPELAADKRKTLLAALDAKTAAEAAEARRKVIDDARAAHTYVDAAKVEADLQATRETLDDEIQAAYADAISRAIEKLAADYAIAGSPRRTFAENESGYKGPYYKLERVERYFGENWKGGKLSPAIEKCTIALGFKKDSDGGDLKDPSVDNVDKLCGVRDGLVTLLASYKGRNKLSVLEVRSKP